MHNQQQEMTFPMLRQIFFLSFYLAQGLPFLQELLLVYVKYSHPNWHISQQQKILLLHQLAPAIHALVARGQHESLPEPGRIEAELQDMLNVLEEEWEKTPTLNLLHHLSSILVQIVTRDWHFLCKRGGRPRPPARERYSRQYDPHFSFYCHFVLAGHELGCETFDALFVTLRKAVATQDPLYLAIFDDPNIEQYLHQVIETYNATHPDMPVPTFSTHHVPVRHTLHHHQVP